LIPSLLTVISQIPHDLAELLQSGFQVFDDLLCDDVGIGEIVSGGFEGLTFLVKQGQESRFLRLGHYRIRSLSLTPEFVLAEDVEVCFFAAYHASRYCSLHLRYNIKKKDLP
jgi:hypothetical protein